MSNLGSYITLTKVAKKFGSPEAMIAFLAICSFFLGYTYKTIKDSLTNNMPLIEHSEEENAND